MANLSKAVSATSTSVWVFFSAPVNGATTVGNWGLSTGSVTAVSAQGSDQKTFRLTVSGLTSGTSYTVTANAGITDTSGGALSPNSFVFVAGKTGGNVIAVDALSARKQPRARKGSSGLPLLPTPQNGHVNWPVG